MAKVSSQVASSLIVPDGWAYLDWITGMIRIDCKREQWERLQQKVPHNDDRFSRRIITEDELFLLETYTHEVAHYLQLCTTGYLYRLARDLLDIIGELPDGETVDCIPEADLTRVAARIHAIKEERLCVPTVRGLDVISIVESAAFLVHKRTHYVDLTAEEYDTLLVGQPTMYQTGYEIVREYLGNSAFGTYPLLASLSLWTDSPPETLVYLCEEIASVDPVQWQQIAFGHLVEVIMNRPGFIGPPWPGRGCSWFPEYEVAIRRFDGKKRQNYLCWPYFSKYAGPLIEEAGPIFVLNDDDEGRLCVTTPLSWSTKTDDEKGQIAQLSLLLFGLSTHIQRSADAVSKAPG